jgi:CRP/FNR family transcriptional regulator, cyclic AMP receptor protein
MPRYTGDTETLRRLAPFSWLSSSQLSWALPAVESRCYERGALIQRTGQDGDGLHIVLSGRVSVLHEDGNARELVVTSIGPHEFFGELGLFEGQPCAASVRADCRCETLFIPRKVALECLEENSRAAMCMLNKITARLCDTHAKLAHLALTTVEQRVATTLVEHSVEAEGVWRVQVGSEQISSMVAASREMVSRVVKKMIAVGIVRRERRKLVVLDRDAVTSLAGNRRRGAAEAQQPA